MLLVTADSAARAVPICPTVYGRSHHAPYFRETTGYRDELWRIRIDTRDPAAASFFRSYKEVLKARFRQIDIWITAHEIEVI